VTADLDQVERRSRYGVAIAIRAPAIIAKSWKRSDQKQVATAWWHAE
jgi:hypothetical protein